MTFTVCIVGFVIGLAAGFLGTITVLKVKEANHEINAMFGRVFQ